LRKEATFGNEVDIEEVHEERGVRVKAKGFGVKNKPTARWIVTESCPHTELTLS
jgi:hypothetical protein